VDRLRLPTLAAGAFAVVLAFGPPAFSQAAHDHAAVAPPASANLQGNDQQSWINDPHMHAFYDLSVKALAQGPGHVDKVKFESDARDIFRAFAVARGVKPEMMLEHLKLIPGQVIDIATSDPKALASYDNFVVALFGPQ
jgi:hypothetical protein